jgi:hypothetical protein
MEESMKEQFINAMVTALEGGSNYWCSELAFYDAKGVYMSMEDWFESGTTIRLQTEDEDDALYTVTREAFFDSVKQYFPDWEEVFNEDGDYDADDADQWLQFGVFGAVVYG